MRSSSVTWSSSAAVLLVSMASLLTLTSCDMPPQGATSVETMPASGAIRVRNFSLKRTFHRVVSESSRAVDRAVSQAGGAINKGFSEAEKEAGAVGRTAASSVVAKEFRNAAGQIVDAANTVISYLPTSWPAELGPDAVSGVIKSARSQVDAALAELQHQAKVLEGMSASDAEARINGLLSPRQVQMPRISIPGIGQAYVPASAPLYVKIRPSQWESSHAANLQIKLDFFGLKTYRIGFGCIGFPNGFTQPPKFAINGGCDNPWKLLAKADLVANTTKKVANDIGREIEKLGPQILGVLRKVGGQANNPRNIPPLALDLPINELLAMCCSLSFPSSKAAKEMPPDAPDAPEGENSAAAEAIGNVAKDAALSFTVPELSGISFELSPDLSPVVYFDDTWTNAGQMQIGVEVGFFGLFVAGVKMGCITFGETWEATPKFSFEGGCDKSWSVDFSAGGYTSSTHRLDARVTSGTKAGIAPAPPLPPPPAVVPMVQAAVGGTATTLVQNGKTYRVHTYTVDDDSSEFVVTSEMEGVPIEYLMVAGGGSGASNKTGNTIGVGGGGGGGVLTNLGKAPLYLSAGTYTVVVGEGGTASYLEGNGLNGGNSSINGTGLVALGGGGGGRLDSKANDGGSGGGAGYRSGSRMPGAPIAGQGHPGGLGRRAGKGDGRSAGGGGGGFGGPGGDSPGERFGGNGGPGLVSTIAGAPISVAGGGGGGGGGRAGTATHGAGAGAQGAREGFDATPHTGGGGGGASSHDNHGNRGGNGGSGIVIIRYPVVL